MRGAPVQDVNGQTGSVSITPANISAATSAQGSKADSAVQPGDDITVLVNNAGYLTTVPVDSVNGKTGSVTLNAGDVGAATTAQGTKADSAVQPGDGVSVLTNDAGFITIREVPEPGVTSVNGDAGPSVTLDASDVGAAPSSHVGSGGSEHALVTTTDSGFMSPGDKSHLNSIETGAQQNVPTNLSKTRATGTMDINSSTGSSVTLSAATYEFAGVMSNTDKSKLDGIASGAQTGTVTTVTLSPITSNGSTTVPVLSLDISPATLTMTTTPTPDWSYPANPADGDFVIRGNIKATYYKDTGTWEVGEIPQYLDTWTCRTSGS